MEQMKCAKGLLWTALTLAVIMVTFNTHSGVDAMICISNCTPELRATRCQPLPACPHGVFANECLCCDMCYKGEGESCGGGLGRYDGACNPDLDCTGVDQETESGLPLPTLYRCVRKAVTA